jgi:hypothetical protein
MPSIERNVTHFAYAGEPFGSPNPLSPIFSNLSSDTSMPNSMLTTSSSTKDAPFLSVTRAGLVAHIDDTGCTDPWNDFIRRDTLVEENGYRLLSEEPTNNCTLAKMVGLGCDYEFPFIHQHSWQQADPRTAFDPA